MWIEMKSITLFEVIIVVGVLIDCESYGKEVTINACENVCCMLKKHKEAGSKQRKPINKDFTVCCRKSKNCLLPEQFYSRNCTEQLMNLCASTNRSRKNNLTSWAEHCCKNVNNCPENNTRLMENSSKCFDITVMWKEVDFPSKHDRLLQKWNKEKWNFFLRMASQSCLSLNNNTPQSSVKYKYKYPVYTTHENDKDRIVYGYQAPQAFLVMEKEKFVMLNVVGDSFKNLWVTMFLCVTWTLISGVIIWLLEHRNNPLQFPSSFWEGVCEGAWWAVVTMTTVGYGDKTPKSVLGRIFSAAWMVVGVIILSIFTADITSRLTEKTLKSHDDNHLFMGKKIGVPHFSKSHFRKEMRGGKIIEMNSTELLKKLTSTTSTPAIKRIVLHDCNTIKAHENLQSVRVLDGHIVGVCANIPFSVLECVRERVKLHLGDDNISMTDDAPDCEDNTTISEPEYNTRRGVEPSDVTCILLYVSGGLVVVMFVAGGVWNLIKAKDLLQKEDDVEDRDNGSVAQTAEGAIEIRVITADEDGRKT